MDRLTFDGDFCDIAMCRENPCPYDGACTQRQVWERLKAYEETGLEPEDIISATDMAKIACALHELNAYKDIGPVDHLRYLIQAEQDGRMVVLDEKIAISMCAGARAIDNNKRLFGVTYEYDIFGVRGGPKEINYYEAAKKLREIAGPVLDRDEAEAALKGGEGK